MKISLRMTQMLRDINRAGRYGRPYEIGNTNRTADSLVQRGLVKQIGYRHFRVSYELTVAGAALVGGFDL